MQTGLKNKVVEGSGKCMKAGAAACVATKAQRKYRGKKEQEREIVGINKVQMPRNLAPACSSRYIYARLPSEGLAA